MHNIVNFPERMNFIRFDDVISDLVLAAVPWEGRKTVLVMILHTQVIFHFRSLIPLYQKESKECGSDIVIGDYKQYDDTMKLTMKILMLL